MEQQTAIAAWAITHNREAVIRARRDLNVSLQPSRRVDCWKVEKTNAGNGKHPQRKILGRHRSSTDAATTGNILEPCAYSMPS